MAATGGGSAGGTAGGVRAGGAFVELFAKDKIGPVLDKLQKRFAGIGSALTKAGAVGLGAGAALLAPLTGFLSGGIDRAAELKDVAEIFGLTTEAASRMAYAFEVAGGGIQDLTPALAKLAQANTGGRPLDEYLADVTEELLGIEDASARVRAAGEIFGDKFAVKFLDVAGDLRWLMAEAPLLDLKTAVNAERVQQAFNKMSITFKTALLPLLETLTPIVQTVAEFARANAGLLLGVAALGAGLVTLGVAGVALGFTFSGLGVIVGVVKASVLALAATIKSVVAFLASPVGLTVAALAGLGYLFVTQTETGRRWASAVGGSVGAAVADIRAGLAGLVETAMTVGVGIKNALAAGDYQLAWQIALAGVQLEWAKFTLDLTGRWNTFKGVVVDGWHDAVTSIRLTLSPVVEYGKFAFKVLGEAWDMYVIQPFNAFKGWIDDDFVKPWKAAVDWLKETFQSLARGIGAAMQVAAAAIAAPLIALGRMVDDAVGEKIRGKLLDAQLAIQAELGKIAAVVNPDIDARRQGIQNAADLAQRGRDAARADAMAAAKAEAFRAAEELAELARRAAANVPVVRAPGGGQVELPKAAELERMLARGVFNGPLGQQLGAQNQFQKRALTAAEKTATATDTIMRILSGAAGGLTIN